MHCSILSIQDYTPHLNVHSHSSYKQWRRHLNNPGQTVRYKMVTIGDSIWYSSSHKSHWKDSEGGITEFDTKTMKVVQTIEYPNNIDITPEHHVCCKYNDKIYIIDGEYGCIILFDTVTKTFEKKLDFPKIAWYPSAVVVFDKIHIFYGEENEDNYFMYNIKDNTLKAIKLKEKNQSILCVAAMRYKNRIIRFGGYNYDIDATLDGFEVSPQIIEGKEDENEDVFINKWITNPKWILPKAIQLHGRVLYKHYVIIFGGAVWKDDASEYLDSICILDLENSDEGWKELDLIKCPIPSQYVAVIGPDDSVHLVVGVSQWPNWQNGKKGHYSIPISTILGDKFVRE